MDSVANESIILANDKVSQKDMGTPIKIKTAYGQQFTVNTLRTEKKKENDYIYTNIMAVRGIAKTDAAGNTLKDENGNPVIGALSISEVNGAPLVSYAFQQRFGAFGGQMVSIAILLFAFSTTLGWSFYGGKAIEYLFGNKAIMPYKIAFVAITLLGATIDLSVAWGIADTLNALMALPNLIGVLLLSGLVLKITKNYSARKLKKTDVHIEPMLSAYEEIQWEQEQRPD